MRCALLVTLTACLHPAPAGHATTLPDSPGVRRIPIAVTRRGFEPDVVDVRSDETVTLVFTRTVERTCVKRVLVYLDRDHDVARDLPLGQPVAISLHCDRPGELVYACSMQMTGGTIRVSGPFESGHADPH